MFTVSYDVVFNFLLHCSLRNQKYKIKEKNTYFDDIEDPKYLHVFQLKYCEYKYSTMQ